MEHGLALGFTAMYLTGHQNTSMVWELCGSYLRVERERETERERESERERERDRGAEMHAPFTCLPAYLPTFLPP